jgi:NAD(P)H-binding
MVTADLTVPDPSVPESAVQGADAVLSGLGPRSTADAGITAPGTKAVVRAMQATGATVVVLQSLEELSDPAPASSWRATSPGRSSVRR